MNERIAKLYDQAIMLESNGDYVAGELDPVKFAELIVRECARVVNNADLEDVEGGDASVLYAASEQVKRHFGVKIEL